MGKKLIIKGANFTENAIGEPTVPKLTELLTPLTVGCAWTIDIGYPHQVPRRTGDNQARASTPDIIDISAWARYIGTVNLTPKAGYKIAAYFGNNGTDDNILSWAYTNSGETLSVSISTITHALIMVASNDNTALSSTDWNTYLVET